MGLSIGVHSGFNPHPVSVFFLPHDGDILSFVHLLPPNSTVDQNAPSPLVVFCANCGGLQIKYAPSSTSFTAAVSLYRSVALAGNLITQKNEVTNDNPPLILKLYSFIEFYQCFKFIHPPPPPATNFIPFSPNLLLVTLHNIPNNARLITPLNVLPNERILII